MKPRFIVADNEVAQSFGTPVIIMLSDVGYWNENFDELQAWCRLNGAEQQGMTVNIPSESVLTAFLLRWS
jgi:hypothetical protein